MNCSEVLGKLIKEKRTELGYSIRKLSDAVGISGTELTRIESGERVVPNLLTLIYICKVLGLDLNNLLALSGFTNDGSYILNTPDIWKTPNGDVDIYGRLIGGCIDCLKYLIGTKYDYTKEFIERYKDDGIVWYFDNFALKTEDLYFTLWQMKEAGWFKYAKGFVFGKTLFEGTETGLSYEDAVTRALGKEVPIIMEADIGHVKPAFSVINGAKGRFISKAGKGSLEMSLT